MCTYAHRYTPRKHTHIHTYRRQGFFVAVALTRPFGFEGNRKLEQADTLVAAMEEVSNLVVRLDLM